MPEVVRTGVDIGEGDTGNGCQPCPYGVGSPNVFANNFNIIRLLDPVSCGGEAINGSSNVFVNNRNVHRRGDATSCGVAITGSSTVIANGA
jgi:uncharacterized Zn-binding protein involved in type VI secretion